MNAATNVLYTYETWPEKRRAVLSTLGQSMAFLTFPYHVPRSQVWAGSRGRQNGQAHLHTNGHALCGKRGWYERPLYPGEHADRCPRCMAKANRLGLQWPPDSTTG